MIAIIIACQTLDDQTQCGNAPIGNSHWQQPATVSQSLILLACTLCTDSVPQHLQAFSWQQLEMQ
jgi:hypothetical protein